jgi:hypothetical protein
VTLPIDTSGIDEPLPDPGHEAIRVAAIAAIEQVWVIHQQLADEVAALKARVDALPFTTAFGPTATVTVSPIPGDVTTN